MMRESKIIEGLKKNDPRIIGYFDRKYRSFMLSIAVKIVKDSMDAEDVVQESMLKIISNISSFDPANSFKGWLWRIVHNSAITHYNRNKCHKFYAELSDYEPSQKKSSNFFDSFISNDLVNKAMARLYKYSSNQYMYARLYYICQLNYEEISADLEVPIGTVKAGVSRASESLRQFIVEYDRLLY